MARLPAPDLIVWDEAAHCAAATWQRIHAAYAGAYHVGLDATPERLDGKGLRPYFDEIVLGPPVRWLIDNGYLSEYKLFCLPGLDMGGVHTMAGDFNKKEAAERLDGSKVVGDALAHYRKYCPEARAVVFAWSVKASREIAARFNFAGIPAAHLDGDVDKQQRRRIIADYRAGVVRVLCNVDIVGEGFDLPAVEAAFCCTPTQSRRKFLQQVGRALRTYPGKERALLFDHAGNTERLKLLPDDEIQWSLDGRERGNRASDSEPSVRICGKCFAAGRPTDTKCRECGYEFPVNPREMEVEAGELAEVDPAELRRARAMEQRSAQSLEELQEVERRRGYKPGWARHVMRARGQRSRP